MYLWDVSNYKRGWGVCVEILKTGQHVGRPSHSRDKIVGKIVSSPLNSFDDPSPSITVFNSVNHILVNDIYTEEKKLSYFQWPP